MQSFSADLWDRFAEESCKICPFNDVLQKGRALVAKNPCKVTTNPQVYTLVSADELKTIFPERGRPSYLVDNVLILPAKQEGGR